MSEYAHFFSTEQRGAIVSAITAAENKTSAELRLHLEDFCDHHPEDRAAFVFEELGMHQTSSRNGVLIYLAVVDHDFAVIGDIGIHSKVGQDFWVSVSQAMETHFRAGEFLAGILATVEVVGTRLAEHFPIQADDVNELSNDISMGQL